MRRFELPSRAGVLLRGLSLATIVVPRRRSVYVPSSRAGKLAALRRYAREYSLRILVETGTHTGDTIAALAPRFDLCFTIELSEFFHAAAVARFRGAGNIRCLWGDSAVLLPAVLQSIDGPCLFWLDAHASGGRTADSGADPIARELAAIYAHPVKDHVILIDDARGHDVDRIVGGAPADTEVSVRNDIIRIVPRQITRRM